MKNTKFYCEICKKSLCPEHAYMYVDGNNISITKSAPILCNKCYETQYGVKVKSELETFKEHLIRTLLQFQVINNIDSIKINKIIEYINNL